MIWIVLREYPVGSKVWLKHMANSHRRGGKLDSVHLDPYTIVEMAHKGRYRLQNSNEKVLKKLYNGVLLKEFFSPTKSSNINSLLQNLNSQRHQKLQSARPTRYQSDQNLNSQRHQKLQSARPTRYQSNQTEVSCLS